MGLLDWLTLQYFLKYGIHGTQQHLLYLRPPCIIGLNDWTTQKLKNVWTGRHSSYKTWTGRHRLSQGLNITPEQDWNEMGGLVKHGDARLTIRMDVDHILVNKLMWYQLLKWQMMLSTIAYLFKGRIVRRVKLLPRAQCSTISSETLSLLNINLGVISTRSILNIACGFKQSALTCMYLKWFSIRC